MRATLLVRVLSLPVPFHAALAMLLLAGVCRAEIKVAIGHSADSGFAFPSIPAPSSNDAATRAEFTLIDGSNDPYSGKPDVLHDGRLPTQDDEPPANFCFAPDSNGGRLRIDLHRVIPLKQVNSYSWHTGSRAPQLYAADGTSDGFDAAPRRGADPLTCGWKLIARVDTRSAGEDWAGQHGVSISSDDPVIGEFRYLLFDTARTETSDPWGNTFFSEIDVIGANDPPPTPIAGPMMKHFSADGGRVRFSINLTTAPDLADWCVQELAPVVQIWYPKIVALLPSAGFQAPRSFTLQFHTPMPDGVPAMTLGRVISLDPVWFRRERMGEARGAVIHELVHVVQCYSRASPPNWVTEGIPDYIRWFLYEPEAHGAEITPDNIAWVNYDSSYRPTGNFLSWVTQQHDQDLVPKLNAAAREGRYDDQLWKTWTGQTVQELSAAWKKYHAERLAK